MPQFRVHIVRTIKEQNYFDIEAVNAEVALGIAQDAGFSDCQWEHWDLLEVLKENINVEKLIGAIK